MKLLLLGGPKFLGRGIADAALAAGHELTFFNRGETNPDEYPEAEKLRGDRDGGLTALDGGEWDAVLDTSGYVPRIVRAGAEFLAPAVDHYTFVSSISVYADTSKPVHEESALATLDDPGSEDISKHYGALKAACERTVDEVFAGRNVAVRAGLIVGPRDPTGRFTYWPTRVAAGGEVLVPGRPERQVQFVDVRDLGAWIVGAVEQHLTGPFNVTGPIPALTMGELVETCRSVSGSDATFTWVDEPFLLEREVGAWMELPLWLPERDDESAFFMNVDVTKALDGGLAFRPLEETVRDTLAWAATAPPPAGTAATGPVPSVGLAPERERELLAAWHKLA